MYANVILDRVCDALDPVFTYAVPEGMDVRVGQQVRGTAGGVAHDDGVRPHGHDRLGGVLEGLALGH